MQAPLANNFTTNGVSLPLQVEMITETSHVWSSVREYIILQMAHAQVSAFLAGIGKHMTPHLSSLFLY